MKTEVYSWRVSPEIKANLEREARRRGISLSAALDLAAREWLRKGSSGDGEEDQRRLRKAVMSCIGTIEGSNPYRSENSSATIQDKLRRRYGR